MTAMNLTMVNLLSQLSTCLVYLMGLRARAGEMTVATLNNLPISQTRFVIGTYCLEVLFFVI